MKIFASTCSASESFSPIQKYTIVSGNFLICSSAQFFCWRESWNEHVHDCRHFFRGITTARCKQLKLVVYHSKNCLHVNLLKKSRKSTKWPDDEVELLLMVTKEYKTKQILQCSLTLARRCCCDWHKDELTKSCFIVKT